MSNQHLFRRIGHKAAVVTHSEAEGDDTAEVAIALALVPLHLGHPLADAVPFGLGDRRQEA